MYFPVFLSLAQRRVLAVGQGPLIDNKIRLAEAAGALVDHRAEAPDDLTPYTLVIADLPEAAGAELSARARAQRVTVNIIDRPALSDFSTPAIVDRAPITIAIGSDGSAPVLARRLRAQIEALVPPRTGALAGLIGRYRRRLAGVLSTIAERRQFWDRVLDGPIAALALAGRETEAEAALRAAIAHPDRSSAGLVQMVGAGPGDPDLLTLKAARALQEADVILYDDLVSAGVLDRARREAERIYVGKRAGQPGIGQVAIQRLMIEQAQAGRRVVRLKGGDPFIFGRGGEEIEALRAADIPVEVIPGITAALGAAAEQALPLTHRGEATALTLLTAHLAEEANAIDWSRHADARTTLAVYMGRETAGAVARHLIAAGRAAETPVAVMARATRPDSRTVTGQLAHLPRLVAQAGEGPALLIIGQVVARSDAARAEAASASLPLAAAV